MSLECFKNCQLYIILSNFVNKFIDKIIVTFTDGSDMYIHLEVLYIAVMLGIVQKEENKSCQRCLNSIFFIYWLTIGHKTV